MPMETFFGLKDSRELFAKLEWEYKGLSRNPLDRYHAWNFVVTAWHLADWWAVERRSHGQTTHAKRAETCSRHPVLKICEHLANGAKHLELNNKSLTAVATGGHGRMISTGSIFAGWAPNVWKRRAWKESLEVELDGQMRTLFGDRMSLERVAGLAMTCWRDEYR